jgi:hypothetical protein
VNGRIILNIQKVVCTFLQSKYCQQQETQERVQVLVCANHPDAIRQKFLDGWSHQLGLPRLSHKKLLENNI